MAGNWQPTRLGDHVSLKGGLSYKGAYVDKGDSLLVSMGCVSHTERFLPNGAKRYGGEFSESHRLGPGDLVIATRQQSDDMPILGYPAMIPDALKGRDVVAATNLYKITNSSAIDNRFLYWLLRGKEYRERILKCSKGTTVRMLTKDAIEDFEFLCPPELERKRISWILDSLDDKIELNRKLNRTLEEMARAIFKSWFVDFDPVRAKAEDRDPGLPKHIADLFPDSFEDSELGAIPKGWKTRYLADVADVNWGDTNVTKRSYENSGFTAFSASGPDGFLPYHDYDRSGIVVSAIGANAGLTWMARGKWSCIKNTIRFWSIDSDVSNEYLFHSTSDREKWPLRGSAQPFIAQGDARKMRILIPARGIARVYGQLVESHYARMGACLEESRTLAAIRDTLLPKLISGEIRVKDAERFVGKGI